MVDVPSVEQADRFLPPYETDNRISFETPKNLGFSAGPDTNTEFKYKEHLGILNARRVICECEKSFKDIFKREYSGLIETYRTDDAVSVIVTLGTISGLVREVVDDLRAQEKKVGLLRIRYLRPFPNEELVQALKNVRAIGVLEKDISFGNEGTVYTNVNSALHKAKLNVVSSNYIAGLGGRNIEKHQIEEIFSRLESSESEIVFVGLREE